MQRECFEKVDGATELAEKQNALTMTLEAKVGEITFHFVGFTGFNTYVFPNNYKHDQIEKLHRDRQLRTAQLTALQQREDSVRSRLLASLQDYCQRVKVAAPPDTSKLVDLLHFNAEVLRSRTGSVLDSSLYYTSNNLTSSPPLRGASEGQGKSVKGKKSHDGSKKSPSSSPEAESSSGDNRNGIRARLSPASKRFVAQSVDFASSTGTRRLPSPVVSRVSYDHNMRSPSADTAIRRTLAAHPSSSDDLGASRTSATGRSSSRLRDSSRGSAVSYGQSPLLHVSRGSTSTSSTSHTSSSSSNALQERLKEAQRAFAAMRESHKY